MQQIIKTLTPIIQRYPPLYIPALNRILYLLMPMYRQMGVRVESVDDQRVVVSMEKTAGSRSHIGALHAVAIYALGEALGGLFVIHRYGARGWMPVARSFSIEYLKKARRAARAEASFSEETLSELEEKVRAEGRAELTIEATITNEAGETAAILRGTYLILRGRG